MKLPHNKKDILQRKVKRHIVDGRSMKKDIRVALGTDPYKKSELPLATLCFISLKPLLRLLAVFPSTIKPPLCTFAFSCGRRGTAKRWMRSNALKLRPRKKRLIRQLSVATFSHRRRHICTPACSCLLLPVAKRHEGTEFHSGGVKEPECARAAARQGDRSAVDEECVLSPPDLSSTYHPPAFFAFSCWRRGTAKRWMRSNALPSAKPHLREKTPHPSAFSCHLLPPEKAYLYPAFAFSCWRRGTA